MDRWEGPMGLWSRDNDKLFTWHERFISFHIKQFIRCIRCYSCNIEILFNVFLMLVAFIWKDVFLGKGRHKSSLKSRHSGWMANHADLVVIGNSEEPPRTSNTDVRTTDSINCVTNEKIWQLSSLHSRAFRLEWSEGKMAAPETWCKNTWYLLTVDRKV